MSRLALLHAVRLFADTSLDDLMAIDHALRSETYLAGEPVVREGEAGDRFCIVHSGSVVADGEVEVLVLQRDRFHSLIRQRPSILMEACATLVPALAANRAASLSNGRLRAPPKLTDLTAPVPKPLSANADVRVRDNSG